VRYIDNSSGHYHPTLAESARAPQLLRDAGLDLRGATYTPRYFFVDSNGQLVEGPRPKAQVLND